MAHFPDGPNCCSSLSWPQCNKGIFRWFDALGLIRQSKGREIRSSGFVFLLHARRARLSHVARMALTDIGLWYGPPACAMAQTVRRRGACQAVSSAAIPEQLGVATIEHLTGATQRRCPSSKAAGRKERITRALQIGEEPFFVVVTKRGNRHGEHFRHLSDRKHVDSLQKVLDLKPGLGFTVGSSYQASP